MSTIHPQASSFSASYKQTPKFKSFLLKEHANEESRWPNNKSTDNKTDDLISAVNNQRGPVDYSCAYVKDNRQQLNNNLGVDYSSMPPLVAIDQSGLRQQVLKATASSQIPLKKRSKQYESLWVPTTAGDLPLSPVTLPESPQSLSLLEDSDNDKFVELTRSPRQSDNLSDSSLSGSTGKLTELSLSNTNPGDPFYSPTSPGNPPQQYIYSHIKKVPSPYTRHIEYPVAVTSLPYSHGPLPAVNHPYYNPKLSQVNRYFFPNRGPIPSRKVAEELKATQLALFRDSYRINTASPHAFTPYRKPSISNKSMDRIIEMSHIHTENQSSQLSHTPKHEMHDLHNTSLNVCREPNRPAFIPQRPSAFKKSLPSFLDPDSSSSHPSAHVVSRERIESSNDDFMRQKIISEWTFSEVVTYMSRKQDSMNLKFNFTPLSGITGRELMNFSPNVLNDVAPGHGEELFIMLREFQHEQEQWVDKKYKGVQRDCQTQLGQTFKEEYATNTQELRTVPDALRNLQRKKSITDSAKSSYEINPLPYNLSSKPTHFSIDQQLAKRVCVTSQDNRHLDHIVRSPHEYQQIGSLENVRSPHEYQQRGTLENIRSPQEYKQGESLENLRSPHEYKQIESLENIQSPHNYKQRESLEHLRSQNEYNQKQREILENVQSPLDYKNRDVFENMQSPLDYRPRESLENVRSPLEYKHSESFENLKSPQDGRHSDYIRHSYDILNSSEDYDIYNDMKSSPHSSYRSDQYSKHPVEAYQVPHFSPHEQYRVDISSASGSHQLPSAARKSYTFLQPPEYSIPNIASGENLPCGDGETPKPVPIPTVKRGPGRPRKPENELKRKKKRTGRLWEFIRNLLHDPETCPSLVKWENAEEGVFRFVQAEKVAKMWGMRKHNTDMNYEKLSRAMRYYYKGGVFEIVAGRRLVYKFGKTAKNWRPSDPNFPNFQR